jgi:transposase
MGEELHIFSCYEAGRDGFWLDRYLKGRGIKNIVVDSSSIEVSRRARRAKTDRIDVVKLMNMLIRYKNGEQKLWSVLHVPGEKEEDERRVDREIDRLKKERTSHTNRIRSLLVLHGVNMDVGRDFLKRLENVRIWNKERFPRHLKREIIREYRRYELVQEHLKEMEQEKAELLAVGGKAARQVVSLERLRGIGQVSAWKLSHEFFAWRNFKNVKQVGSAAGLVPTPYKSGEMDIEQGISKAGNRRIRRLMIEIGWYWLRYQGQSSLSMWFNKRFGHGSRRIRKIGIVALARKLLVALWKFLEQGLVPEGACLKAY